MYYKFTVLRWIKISTFVVFAAACLLVLRLQISKGGSEIMREFFSTQHFSISTEGINDLIQRRMPHHTGCFELLLIDSFANSSGHDQYIISSTSTGKVLIEGITPIAIASGQVITFMRHVMAGLEPRRLLANYLPAFVAI